MTIKSKADVQFHSDAWQDPRPAVNVKVHSAWGDHSSLARTVIRDNRHPDQEEAFVTYVEDRVSDAAWNSAFEASCEQGWERLQTDAEEVFGLGVKVYAQGRSGGWAVVEGIPDFDSWDATDLARWRRFARYAREQADAIPYDMLSFIFINDFYTEVLDPHAAATEPCGECVVCGGPAIRKGA